MASTWDDTPLFSAMNTLRRHYNDCYKCRAADSGNDPSMMCRDGQLMVFRVMRTFNGLIALKRKAASVGDGRCYPCPNIAAHGKAWAMAVPLYRVTGMQEELF